MEELPLDSYHTVRVVQNGSSGSWSGSVVMLSARRDGTHSEGTRLFDTPALDSREEVRDWALTALKGYREG